MKAFLPVLKRSFLSVIALVFIYSNCAILFNHLAAHLFLPTRLPLNRHLNDLFITFPVFPTYGKRNWEVMLLGKKAKVREEWTNLDAEDYFPFRRGEASQRMIGGKFADTRGKEGQIEAWKFLSRKIRERYNREHPDAPIEKIVIRQLVWPRSKKGFYALKNHDQMEVFELFREE